MHIKFFISILFAKKKKLEDLKILSRQNHVIVSAKSGLMPLYDGGLVKFRSSSSGKQLN